MHSELSDGEIVDSDSDVNGNPVQQQNGFMVEDLVPKLGSTYRRFINYMELSRTNNALESFNKVFQQSVDDSHSTLSQFMNRLVDEHTE
uniref:Uncharacterized protein n=1 Tax=Acrobeloides nanus TaxID=290746 RepID=A0A914EBN1_9BILA